MNRFLNVKLGTAMAMGLLASTQALAQAPVEADAWRFQLTPYVWMTG